MNKRALESLTVWGLITMVVTTAKTHFGWEITDSQIETGLTTLLWVVGAVSTYIGRRRAKGPLAQRG